MGMFDSFIVPLECSTCKTVSDREVQTKAFANILATYRIGDVVEDAPIGEYWLKEDWWCDDCRQKNRAQKLYEHTIYLRLVDGLFLGTYSEADFQEQRKRALDTYEIMRLFQKTAKKGTEQKFLLHRIYHLIKGAREDWKRRKKEKEERKLPTFLPKNEDELLDEIVEMIKHSEGAELNDESTWR